MNRKSFESLAVRIGESNRDCISDPKSKAPFFSEAQIALIEDWCLDQNETLAVRKFRNTIKDLEAEGRAMRQADLDDEAEV